jgi:hypothetical protein
MDPKHPKEANEIQLVWLGAASAPRPPAALMTKVSLSGLYVSIQEI